MSTAEASDYERDVVNEFKISNDLKDDIVYCQKVLRSYIKVHQICAIRLVKNAMSRSSLSILKQLENDIRDLMKDQRKLIGRLRKNIEKHHSTSEMSDTPLDTNLYNAYLSKILYYHFESTYNTIEPVNVQRRFTDGELIRKYGLENSSSIPPSPQKMQISLLKPKSERMSFSSGTSRGTRPPHMKVKRKKIKRNKNQYFRGGNAVKRSRMKLLAALKNAKSMRDKHMTPPRGIKNDSDSESSPSNSQSSAAPSEEDHVIMPNVCLPPEPPEPDSYNQESFLRFFGLYTHSYNEILKNRRPERRKRNVQSTARTDFHYDYHDLVTVKSGSVRGRRQLNWKAQRLSNEEKASVTSTPQSRSSTSSPVDSTPSTPTCVICCRPGEHQLKSCNFCTNLFHVICHDQAYDTADYRPGEFVCPSCMTLRKRMKSGQGSSRY
uniref:PHD-type domain-containing protein n=1 Tax=Phlebotomus papatasi TaxID=29031 RepID=A0A1B0GP89_PHLPP